MGRFFVMEGLDGAGTTTQVARLAQWLRARGRVVHETFEPSDGPVGRLIRASLIGAVDAPHRSTLPWMFAADRADHLQREIEPALVEGDVISDRYYHSSLAYQSMEIPLERVHALNRDFRTPDLTLFVRVDLEVALERIAARGAPLEIFERREQLARIARHYDAVLALLGGLGEPLVEVDGNQPMDAVAAAIQAAVLPLVT